METISEATLDDIPQLVGLLEVLFTQEADFSPDHATQERGLRLLVGSPEAGVVFVARDTDGGPAVGMVSLLFTISTAEGGPACWLEDMVVDPGHRSSGLGSRLLRHAIDHAWRHGFLRISLLADGSNAGAIRFYQRQGFTSSSAIPLRLYPSVG